MSNEHSIRHPLWLVSALTDVSTTEVDEDIGGQQIEAGGQLARRRMHVAVRRAIAKSGVSQAEIARRLGVNKSTVSRMLSNPRNMTIEAAGRLLRAAGDFIVVGSERVPDVRDIMQVEQSSARGLRHVISMQPGNEYAWTIDTTAETVEKIRRHYFTQHQSAHSVGGRNVTAMAIPISNVTNIPIWGSFAEIHRPMKVESE